MQTAKSLLVVTVLMIVAVYHASSELQESSLRRLRRAGACPPIVTRAQWGARAPKSTSRITRPVPKMFIHHTETPRCTTTDRCKSIVKSIQNYHMDTQKWDDIGYNFLVGEDGNVYEGRGWNNVGAHARGWNPTSYGIALLGDFSRVLPNAAALNAVKQLISCGQPGNISGSYTLHGHRDGVCTTCPGDTLYNHIKSWPKFRGPVTPRYC